MQPLVPQRLNEVLAFAFFCAGGGFVISGLPVFYGGMCAIRGRGEKVFAAAGIIPVCRISCVGGSDAGDWIFLLL